MAGKEVSSIVPVVGAAASAALNAWTLHGIARDAIRYEAKLLTA